MSTLHRWNAIFVRFMISEEVNREYTGQVYLPINRSSRSSDCALQRSDWLKLMCASHGRIFNVEKIPQLIIWQDIVYVLVRKTQIVFLVKFYWKRITEFIASTKLVLLNIFNHNLKTQIDKCIFRPLYLSTPLKQGLKDIIKRLNWSFGSPLEFFSTQL